MEVFQFLILLFLLFLFAGGLFVIWTYQISLLFNKQNNKQKDKLKKITFKKIIIILLVYCILRIILIKI